MIKIVKSLAVGLTALAVFGCGGSGSGSSANQFAGAYKNDFFRGTSPDTTLLLVVGTNGATNIVVSDVTGVLFSGTGTTTPGGVLTGTATGTGGTDTFNGTFAAGSPPTYSINITGAMTAGFDGFRFESAGVSPLAGTFTGSFTGSSTATLTGTVTSAGVITGTASGGGENAPFSGTVSALGVTNFTVVAPGVTGTFTGNIYFVPGSTLAHASGTWTAPPSLSGTWTAIQS
jgi:fibronectin-binding autotransporter adhesin